MPEKFERLFSQDPLKAFEKIEEHYDRYLEIAFKLDKNDYSELDKERMKTLKSNNNRSKEPYIEILPEYVPAEGVNSIQDLASKFEDAFGGEKISQQYFDFVSKGLMNYRPYGHQVGMMDKAFAGKGENGEDLQYKNTVITSGTGSGKTESFLLPLLADIFKEAKTWPEAQTHNGWYKNDDEQYIPCQREGDERPAAIRALVLYPMNALVEDQMARLRKALDSDAVRNFMKDNLKDNRIYFGSYNGSTIGKKSYNLLEDAVENKDIKQDIFDRKKTEVYRELCKISENYSSIRNYYEKHADREDALYISPRLDSKSTTAEMITRWDMQNWPPDILITNTSMLSIMLMRKAEAPMIEQTRRWLAAEDLPEEKREEAKKDRVFHVVVDELHLYRGTSGSEVACLLRMLYGALGLDPVVDDGSGNKIPNPQIKILASSASFGADEEIGGRTTRWMVEQGYRPRKMVLVVDSRWNAITYAQKGNTYFTVTAHGQGGHSACPWESQDSIATISAAYLKLREAWDRQHPISDDHWCDTLSATVLKADGGALNCIPDDASFVVNLRSVEAKSADRVEKFIRDITGLDVTRGEDSKPFASKVDDPLIARLQARMRRQYPGEEIPLIRSVAATDARCFYDCGTPVVAIGAKGEGDHAADERVSLSGIAAVTELLTDFIAAER